MAVPYIELPGALGELTFEAKSVEHVDNIDVLSGIQQAPFRDDFNQYANDGIWPHGLQ